MRPTAAPHEFLRSTLANMQGAALRFAQSGIDEVICTSLPANVRPGFFACIRRPAYNFNHHYGLVIHTQSR